MRLTPLASSLLILTLLGSAPLSAAHHSGVAQIATDNVFGPTPRAGDRVVWRCDDVACYGDGTLHPGYARLSILASSCYDSADVASCNPLTGTVRVAVMSANDLDVFAAFFANGVFLDMVTEVGDGHIAGTSLHFDVYLADVGATVLGTVESPRVPASGVPHVAVVQW